MAVALSALAAVIGVTVGALLARRNARHDHTDKLLAEAMNDLVSAIADAANGELSAQRRYASSTSRIALHGSPAIVRAFADFQRDGTTTSAEGRRRLVSALQTARRELGRPSVSDDEITVLLFGVKRSPTHSEQQVHQRDA